MRSILIVEIVSGDVHRLAGGLGSGDPGLVAHQLIEIGPDLEEIITKNKNNPEAQAYMDKASRCISHPLKHLQEEIDTTNVKVSEKETEKH